MKTLAIAIFIIAFLSYFESASGQGNQGKHILKVKLIEDIIT